MTTREELDARLAEFDRRRAAADAVLARRTDTGRSAQTMGQEGLDGRSGRRLGRWLGRSA